MYLKLIKIVQIMVNDIWTNCYFIKYNKIDVDVKIDIYSITRYEINHRELKDN